jgi:hypothetical protein
MVCKHYGRSLSAQELPKAGEIAKNGVSKLIIKKDF